MAEPIGVVIPARNARETIAAAVASVLSQSHAASEIIVVDDGSEDGTAEAARSAAPCAKTIPGPCKGPGAARNAGIRSLSSPWIAFLDADDVWLPSALEVLSLSLDEQSAAGLAFGDVLFAGAEGPRASFLARKREATGGCAYAPLLRECFILTSGVLSRRDALLEAGLFDESDDFRYGGEDWDLWLRIARRRPLAIVKEPVARRRFEPSNLSADSFRLAEARVRVLRKHKALDTQRPLAPAGLIDGELGHWLFSYGYLLFLRGEIGAARSVLREGAGLVPLTQKQEWLLRASSLPAPLALAASRAWRLRHCRTGPTFV